MKEINFNFVKTMVTGFEINIKFKRMIKSKSNPSFHLHKTGPIFMITRLTTLRRPQNCSTGGKSDHKNVCNLAEVGMKPKFVAQKRQLVYSYYF